jgi:hypothetical protein
MAVERGEVLVQPAQIKKLVDAAQQVIGRNVIIEVEQVEQLLLPPRSFHHHGHRSLANALLST